MSLRRWEGLRLDVEALLRRAGPALRACSERAGPRLARAAHQWGPRLERLGWDLVELTAGPRRAMKQLALAVALQSCVVAWHVLRKGRTSRRSAAAQALVDALARAPSRDAWCRAAQMLDAADGSDAWRARGGPGETLLDAKRLGEATQRLARIPRRGGVHGAMYALRGGALLARGAHGLLDPRLHARARAGGPALVEAYLTAATNALEYVATAPDPTVPLDARLAFFNECRHAHGRTALLLSGGAGMGIYHLGVVQSLRRAGLLPRVVSGASAGSIVAALLCCRDDRELDELYEAVRHQKGRNLDDEGIEDLGEGKSAVYFGEAFTNFSEESLPRSTSRETFRKLEDRAATVYRLDFFRWRSAASLRDDLLAGLRGKRLREPAVMNGDHLAEVIRADVGGDVTFQEAFDKTGRILNVPVKAVDAIDDTKKITVRMLNYLTAPHVVVWSASRASCSVPGVYAPFPLLARDPDGSLRYEGQDGEDHFEPTLYVDGSMGADLPIDTMKAMFNCEHFICSQVNAHAAILGDSALRLTGAEAPGVLEDRVSLGKSRETPGAEDVALAGLAFLKHQLKAWVAAGARFCATLQLGRAANAIGADLIPWQLGGWALALLTQPYEGRPEDVTIVPWAGHLSLFGSVLSSLTNATGDGALRLEAVLDAGERNTWRELPKIRDHCAVEVALETGVQRLRRSLLAARQSGSPRGAPLGRTPSFYTSPSLLQLSGLNVVDPLLRSGDPDSPPSTDGFVDVPPPRRRSASETEAPILKSMHMANFYYRHSNRSSKSLNSQRSNSDQSIPEW